MCVARDKDAVCKGDLHCPEIWLHGRLTVHGRRRVALQHDERQM